MLGLKCFPDKPAKCFKTLPHLPNAALVSRARATLLDSEVLVRRPMG